VDGVNREKNCYGGKKKKKKKKAKNNLRNGRSLQRKNKEMWTFYKIERRATRLGGKEDLADSFDHCETGLSHEFPGTISGPSVIKKDKKGSKGWRKKNGQRLLRRLWRLGESVGSH